MGDMEETTENTDAKTNGDETITASTSTGPSGSQEQGTSTGPDAYGVTADGRIITQHSDGSRWELTSMQQGGMDVIPYNGDMPTGPTAAAPPAPEAPLALPRPLNPDMGPSYKARCTERTSQWVLNQAREAGILPGPAPAQTPPTSTTEAQKLQTSTTEAPAAQANGGAQSIPSESGNTGPTDTVNAVLNAAKGYAGNVVAGASKVASDAVDTVKEIGGNVVDGAQKSLGEAVNTVLGLIASDANAATTEKSPTSFSDKALAAETDGTKLNVTNEKSSAFGLGQITAPTLQDILQKHFVNAWRQDATEQKLASAYLAADNWSALNKTLGRAPTDAEQYLAWFLGIYGAKYFLTHTDLNDPEKQKLSAKNFLLDPRQADSNTETFYHKDAKGKVNLNDPITVKELMQWATNKAGTGTTPAPMPDPVKVYVPNDFVIPTDPGKYVQMLLNPPKEILRVLPTWPPAPANTPAPSPPNNPPAGMKEFVPTWPRGYKLTQDDRNKAKGNPVTQGVK